MSLLSLVIAKLLPLEAGGCSENIKSADFANDPFTPFRGEVPMDEFRADVFVDGIFRNVFSRKVEFDTKTWRGIASLCRANFDELASRIRLQLLFLATKIDPEECVRNRKAKVSHSLGQGEDGAEAGETYDIIVKEYVVALPELLVDVAAVEVIVEARNFLAKPIIKKALKLCLGDVGLDFDDTIIQNIIASLKVYHVVWDAVGLRGCCVRDGIVVNSSQISFVGGTQTARRKADFFTLIAHEFAHFAARILTGNFNFSSPLSGVSAADGPRMDPDQVQHPGKYVELGRLMEIKLFGKQPYWATMDTPLETVEAFSSQLGNAEELPLHLPALAERKEVSYSSGIDHIKKRRRAGLEV